MKLMCCVLLITFKYIQQGKQEIRLKKVNDQNNNLSLLVNSYFMVHKHVIYTEDKIVDKRNDPEYSIVLHTTVHNYRPLGQHRNGAGV